MNDKREVRTISTFLFASIFLVAIAFLTINSTFAVPETKNLEWSVYYGEPSEKGNAEGKVNVGLNNIDLSVRLDKYGEEYSVLVDVINNGSFNAKLEKFDITDLSKIVVGTSKTTGKTYYVSDYVDLTATYVSNNKSNNVVKDNKVLVGDILKYGTTNKISVTVKYKDSKKLDSDKINVLKNYGYVFNLDINISSLYLQK